MQRITITIDDDLLAVIDGVCNERGYTSRSEAVRDIVRASVAKSHSAEADAACFAVLSYVYEHETRDLARRLVNTQHDHHDTSVATMHVHVDHDDCLEVAVLRGRVDAVTKLADSVTTQRGVRHGNLHIVPVEGHAHGHAHHHHHDSHTRPAKRRTVKA